MPKSSSSSMLGTDSPWTRTSPWSGYSRPTMCLMHTDFPVPEGPRIIEIFPSGIPMFRPRRILLRPKALWTSMNSIASGTPVGRFSPVCHWYSSSSPAGAPPRTATPPRSSASRAGAPARRRSSAVRGSSPCGPSAPKRPSARGSSAVRGSPAAGSSSVRRRAPCSSWCSMSASDGCSWVGAPEQLRAEHPDEVDEHEVEHHRLRGRRAHADGAAAGIEPVVAAHEHDDRRHDHALDDAVEQVRRTLEHPEDQEEPARGDLADLLDDGEVAREVAGADGGDVHEGQDHPRRQQARRTEEEHRVDAHDLQGVDLVRDAHRAELGDDAGADLRGHHVAEGVGHELAQVAPRAELPGVGRRADGAGRVGALDAALQADDEHQAPDHERRGDDEDAGLAQGLAEEAEDAQAVDVAEDAAAELEQDPRGREPPAQRDGHLITVISGWVARSVWVNT